MKKFNIFLLLSPALLAESMLVYRAIVTPENHISISPNIFAAALLPLLFLPLKGSRALRATAMLVSATVLATIFFFQHFNILLQYEEWIERGMPEKPWVEKNNNDG